MNTYKYQNGWDFQQFMYSNFGCSYTKEQESHAFAAYIKLSKNVLDAGDVKQVVASSKLDAEKR